MAPRLYIQNILLTYIDVQPEKSAVSTAVSAVSEVESLENIFVAVDEVPNDFEPFVCLVAAANEEVLQKTEITTFVERVPSACAIPPVFVPVTATPVAVNTVPAAVAKAEEAASDNKLIIVNITVNFFIT